jgi:hypothetical protein
MRCATRSAAFGGRWADSAFIGRSRLSIEELRLSRLIDAQHMHVFDRRAAGRGTGWRAHAGTVFSAPLVLDGRVYVSSRDGTLHAFG